MVWTALLFLKHTAVQAPTQQASALPALERPVSLPSDGSLQLGTHYVGPAGVPVVALAVAVAGLAFSRRATGVRAARNGEGRGATRALDDALWSYLEAPVAPREHTHFFAF